MPKFLKFVVSNPCQSAPSLTILGPLWFIAGVFSFLNYYFQVSCFNVKIIHLAKISQNTVISNLNTKVNAEGKLDWVRNLQQIALSVM